MRRGHADAGQRPRAGRRLQRPAGHDPELPGGGNGLRRRGGLRRGARHPADPRNRRHQRGLPGLHRIAERQRQERRPRGAGVRREPDLQVQRQEGHRQRPRGRRRRGRLLLQLGRDVQPGPHRQRKKDRPEAIKIKNKSI